ncbi:MAG: TPM domain-containing protein [Candidatus Saccharibacteria bacterium]|nr:TPM domain-containing protein [Candidatus Saccharibacteria bacterium]
MKRWLFGLIILLGTVLFVGQNTVLAIGVPPAPSLESPIVDQTNTLTAEQIKKLASQIQQSRKKKDYQLGILVIPSLDGRDIEGYSIDVARTWGIGEKEKNNGVLLLVAKDDRKMRIEVGTGLEGDLTDLESGRIISGVMRPYFQKNDYYGGIQKGVESIAAAVEGVPDPNSSSTIEDDGESGISDVVGFVIFFFLFIVPSWITSVLARSKSWWAGGLMGGIVGLVIAFVGVWAVWTWFWVVGLTLLGLGFDWVVSNNYKQRRKSGKKPSWWAGGTTFGGGSSSGGGFGGGGFGGGGASGSW